MFPKRLAAALLLRLLASACAAMPASAKETLRCPQTLRVSGAVLQSPNLPEGAEMTFQGLQPRELASLVPDSDSEEQAAGVARSVWTFERPDPYGTYVVCE